MPEEAFRIAVLGDSIQWGQGLREEDRFSELVRQRIEQELRRPAVLAQRYAHSGACIGHQNDRFDAGGAVPRDIYGIGSVLGELPRALPSVHAQLNALLQDSTTPPESIDLVLVDGGINPDSSPGPGPSDPFSKLLHPLTNSDDLRQDAARACHERMRGLLERIARHLPNARVVVTGYYPVFSSASDVLRTVPWLYAVVVILPLAALVGGLALQRLSELSRVWAEASAAALATAVDEVNAQMEGPPRIAYAHVPFAPENCICAPRSWLWGLSPQVTALDPLAALRQQLCQERGCGEDTFSLLASVGHPNQEGARQYARAIVGALRALEVLPPAPAWGTVWWERVREYLDRLRGGGGG